MKSWDELITPEEKERMSKYKRKETTRKASPSARILAEFAPYTGGLPSGTRSKTTFHQTSCST